MAIQSDTLIESVRSLLKPHQNLVAVSKLQPIHKIENLYQQKQIHFAENYVQEAVEKIAALKNLSIKWHLIGPLQKNKVKYLKNNFEYIHSVDSLELAKLINQKAADIQHIQKIFLQVNVADEISKNGFNSDSLLKHWAELKTFKNLHIVGLMTMPPLQNNPDENRIYFKKLVEIGKKLNLSEFSMGTSHDYKIALEEGSTWIRIGTLLFGERLTQ